MHHDRVQTPPNTPDQATEALRQETLRIGALIFKNVKRRPAAAPPIESALKQPWNPKTAQMAAAVLILALAISPNPSFISTKRLTRKWRTAIRKSRDPEPDRTLPLALKITEALNHGVGTILKYAVNAAQTVQPHIAQGYDIVGPVIQETVSNRKQLANYHTKHLIAAFQAHLALPEMDQIRALAGKRRTLRITDPACGSGILLKAAADTLRLRMLQEQETTPAGQNRPTLSTVLSGIDILPASVAIAATTMDQNKDPRIKTNILRLQYGPMEDPKEDLREEPSTTGHRDNENQEIESREVGLGAIDLLDPQSRQAVQTAEQDSHLKLRGQHIVIMNPPFTRSLSPEELDQNTQADEDSTATTPQELKAMTQRASDIAQKFNNKNKAPLAIHFATLAQQMITPGGIIAATLPMTALSSPPGKQEDGLSGWHLFRQTIAREFTDVIVVSTATYETSLTSFSQETGIAEVILIARKTRAGETPHPTGRFINLTQTPQDEEEAYSFAAAIRDNPATHPESNETPQVHRVSVRGTDIGTETRVHLKDTDTWPMTAVLNPHTIHTASQVRSGILRRSNQEHGITIPITNLGRLGEQSPGNAYIKKFLNIVPGAPATPGAYPHLYTHNSSTQTTVLITPEHSATPRPGRQKTQEKAQKKAGRLHINTNQRYNSQPLPAAVTEIPCLPGSNWSTFRMDDPEMEQATALWLNTTIGLASQWAISNRTQPGFGFISQPHAKAIPTLDVTKLSRRQLHEMGQLFTEMAQTTLMPASCAWQDPARIELDRRVFQEILGITDGAALRLITWLRNAWCLEPTVQALKGARNVHADSMQVLRQETERSSLDLDLDLTPAHEYTAPAPQAPGNAITPQFLRDLAQAIEAADSTAQYTDLHISAQGSRITITMSTAIQETPETPPKPSTAAPALISA